MNLLSVIIIGIQHTSLRYFLTNKVCPRARRTISTRCLKLSTTRYTVAAVHEYARV